MTEEEARQKWCPMVRMAAQIHGSMGTLNQFSEPGSNEVKISKCLGSACMMWRWIPLRKATKFGLIRGGDSEHGYCGLGGKP